MRHLLSRGVTAFNSWWGLLCLPLAGPACGDKAAQAKFPLSNFSETLKESYVIQRLRLPMG